MDMFLNEINKSKAINIAGGFNPCFKWICFLIEGIEYSIEMDAQEF